MDIFGRIVMSIINEQKNIIGPVALREAEKVQGLTITANNEIAFEGNQKEIIERLVKQYAKLFGNASIEVCKEAIEPILDELKDPNDIPEILK